MTICRFAPSPTGFLHVGNVRTAIINFLYAKKTGGKFYLRFDDTDIERTKDLYRDMIIEDMAWLGLEYDLLIKQSERLEFYQQAKDRLIKSGRLYECYESQSELGLQRKAQIASGLRPIYDRASLYLTDEQKVNYQKQGFKPYYRFLLEDRNISWEDKVKGRVTYSGRHFSDPVLFRENNYPTYTFCSVVDDIDFGVTDIIRGEDHLTNTAIQIQIFEALQAKVPDFSHLALVTAREGKISKREGGFDVKSLRDSGLESMSVINLLSQIGTSRNIMVCSKIDQLVGDFVLDNYSKSATNYDLEEVESINHKLIQVIPFSDLKSRLEAIGISNLEENFWNRIKPNLNFLYEAKEWYKICKQSFIYQHKDTDREFLELARKLLPNDTSADDSWEIWLSKIKDQSNRRGKDLFMPIRLALTGKEHGPELKNILPLLDREEIILRLQ